MDFDIVCPVLDRAALVYAMRCGDPEVEAAYDLVLAAILASDYTDQELEWDPSPQWCERVYGLADAFNRKYGDDA